MENIKAFIFDMDGVIFDSERAVIDCWKIIAPQYGITDIEEHCRAATGVNEAGTRKLFKECIEKYVRDPKMYSPDAPDIDILDIVWKQFGPKLRVQLMIEEELE